MTVTPHSQPDNKTPSAAAAQTSAPDALKLLMRLNLWPGLIATGAGMLASFLVAGFWYPYWRVADMDFWVVYNAFLLNAGLPQEFFDHPGYLSVVLLSGWLKLLHGIGIVDVHSLSALPPVTDEAGFARAWTHATRAGRVLSLMLAMGLVTAFTFLLRALVKDWRLASLGGFLLAFSGGLAMQMRVMRTEMIAGGCFSLALLFLLIAASRKTPWRAAFVGAASLLLTLALLNKIQAIFLICALPILLLPFGTRTDAERGFWARPQLAWPTVAATGLLALILAYTAAPLVTHGLSSETFARMGFPRLALGAKTYWLLIATYVGLGVLTYCIVWRVAVAEALTACFAIVIGASAGLLTLYLQFHPDNAAVVLNPFERMFQFAAGSNPEMSDGRSIVSIKGLQWLFQAVMEVMARRTFILHSSPRPTIFLEWLVVPAIAVAWIRGDHRVVVQAGTLMLAVWGIDLLGTARGLKQEYFILTDPMVIIAAALLMARLVDLRHHRRAWHVGVALIAVHVAISQAEPVKHIFRTGGPDELCGLYHNAQRVERLPVCQKPRGDSAR